MAPGAYLASTRSEGRVSAGFACTPSGSDAASDGLELQRTATAAPTNRSVTDMATP